MPDILDTDAVDEVITVSNEKAYEWTRKVIETEGIPLGFPAARLYGRHLKPVRAAIC